MIMSGWILPDMHEVKCLSYSDSNSHKDVVKNYLLNLKTKDYITYIDILYEYYCMRTRRKVLDLEDFAVIKLGWIKVINSPIKVVFYSPEGPLELLIKHYSKLDYLTIPIDEKQSIINIKIPSKELI